MEGLSYHQKIDLFLQKGSEILLGKEKKLKLALTCLLSGGHLLLEDIPGVGKTTLVHLLGRVFGLNFHRIQFASDLLPSDILGVSIYDQNSQRFVFHKGPIFGQMILADELNRATSKTQSALLEVMEEKKVTIDGKVYPMDRPFMVVATQNPKEHIGTFPLPESQLDRFLMSMEIGHPDKESEKKLLKEGSRKEVIGEMVPLFSASEVVNIQEHVGKMAMSDAIIEYIQQILHTSRSKSFGHMGLSPRAGLGLVTAAKAHAFIEKREFVLPEDVQAVAVNVMSHRLSLEQNFQFHEGREVSEKILNSIEVQ